MYNACLQKCAPICDRSLKQIRSLPFQMRRLRQSDAKQTVISIFFYLLVFPILRCYSPVSFPGLLENHVRLHYRGLHVISHGSSSPFESLVNRKCDLHIKACESFSAEVLTDPLHPHHNDLSFRQPDASTRSKFRRILSSPSTFTAIPLFHIG